MRNLRNPGQVPRKGGVPQNASPEKGAFQSGDIEPPPWRIRVKAAKLSSLFSSLSHSESRPCWVFKEALVALHLQQIGLSSLLLQPGTEKQRDMCFQSPLTSSSAPLMHSLPAFLALQVSSLLPGLAIMPCLREKPLCQAAKAPGQHFHQVILSFPHHLLMRESCDGDSQVSVGLMCQSRKRDAPDVTAVTPVPAEGKHHRPTD